MQNTGTTCKTTKGYPRVTAGPLRHKYIHRIVAAALVGRELKRDEEVHHKDGDRKNFNWNNLMVLGNKDHGWVSSLQHWFMKNHDEQLKKEWDEFLAEEEKKFNADIQKAKIEGKAYNIEDGQIEERWYQHKAADSAS